MSFTEVRDGLLAVKGVTAVHNLHIWALTINQAVLSAHVAIGERKPPYKNSKTYSLPADYVTIFYILSVCHLAHEPKKFLASGFASAIMHSSVSPAGF